VSDPKQLRSIAEFMDDHGIGRGDHNDAPHVRSAADEIERLRAELAKVAAERDELRRFKEYVHQRLDAAGVTPDPESAHKAAGCRIGGRLDELIGDRDRLLKAVERLRTHVSAN
jgi:hypothetical protein